MRRWYHASANAREYEQFADAVRHEHDFVKLVISTRDDLQNIYDDVRLPETAKLQHKAEIFAQMRRNYAKLKEGWGVSKSGYDYWFAEPLNNAQLNTVAAYYDLAPAFQALLHAKGGDLEKFYEAAGDLAKLPLDKRHETLHAYLNTNQNKL